MNSVASIRAGGTLVEVKTDLVQGALNQVHQYESQ